MKLFQLFLIFSQLVSFIISIDYMTKIIAGTGEIGNRNGPGLSSTFNYPFGCAISPDNAYGLIADSRNGEIRKIVVGANQAGTVSTLLNLANTHSLCFSNAQTVWATNIATVRRIDLTTMNSKIITSSGELASIACSHDGNTILITTYKGLPNDTPRNLYILPSSTNQLVNLTVLTTIPDDSLGITFSSDDTFALATTLRNGIYKIMISTGEATKLTLPRALQTPLGISLMNNEYLIAEPATGIVKYDYAENTISSAVALPDSFAICSSFDNSFSLISLYEKHKIYVLTELVSSPTLSPTSLPASKDYTYSILAGSGAVGSRNDVGLAATFFQPWGCAISVDNSYGLIADTGNSMIRKYTFETGAVTTVLSNLRVGFIATNPSQSDLVYFTAPEGIYKFDVLTLTSLKIATASSLAAIAVTPDGRYIFAVTYFGTNVDTSPRIIYRLDLSRNPVLFEQFTTISFDSLGIVISNDGAFAYISGLYDGSIHQIDLTTKAIKRLNLPRTLSGPTGLSISDGAYLLINEYLGVGISSFNLVTKELTLVASVNQANAICLSSDSSIGLISLLTANKIGGLLSSTPKVFTASPTLVPTLSPTMETKTSPPTPEIVNRPYRNYSFSIIAGSGAIGSHDDVGLAASFSQPWGCAISSDHSYGLIADTGNKQLRKIFIGSAIVQTTSLTDTQVGFVCIANAEDAFFTSNLGIHHLDLSTMSSNLVATASMLGAIALSPNSQFLLATTHRGVTNDITPRPLYKLSMSDYHLDILLTVPYDSLGITISSDNLFAYMTALSDGLIYRIDLTLKTSSAINLPRILGGPTGIALIEFGSYLLITEYLGAGISRYNLATGELTLQTAISQSNGICMSSDSSIGLVSLLNANKIGLLQRISNGNDLQPGQCCIPGKSDHYCSYNGVCDESGTYCICADPIHYSPADRCMNYYPSNLPDTCPPLQFPYIPTQHPTPVPTTAPTRQPNPTVCVPGDRTYCSNQGACNSRGDSCVCDDQTHYWPTERCKTRHEGPELEAGQFCTPNAVDIYCSFMGVCNNAGTECQCFDSAHRLPSERCGIWHAVMNGICQPYDRNYCSNRGACSPTGDRCICDDEHHYWSSERCSKSHPGPELPDDSYCCYPDKVDTYCNYMGKCNSAGTKCMCFDPFHRLSSERCLYYYDTLTPEQIAENNSTDPVSADCPGFLSEETTNDQSSDGQENNTQSIVIIVVGVAVGLAFTAIIILFLSRKHTFVPPTAAKTEQMSWYEENPIKRVRLSLTRTESATSTGGPKAPRRQSSLNPFSKKSESYVEISEVSLPSEMIEEQNLGSSY